MAYTYKDFLAKAAEDGRMQDYTQEDLMRIQQDPNYGLADLAAKRDLAAAKTPQQKVLAQNTANQLAAYKPAQMISVGEPFHWGGEEQFNTLVDQVISRPEFSYDAARDPDFSAYRKSMIREGNRAQANALAQSAARTGGIPSSWAVTAAGQAGNYHASKIADAQQGFHQKALDKYLKDRQMDIAALDVLTKERANAYQQYLQNYERAKAAYAMGEWTPEIAKILGLTWAPRVVDDGGDWGYGGGGGGNKPTGTSFKDALERIRKQAEATAAANKGTGGGSPLGGRNQANYLY